MNLKQLQEECSSILEEASEYEDAKYDFEAIQALAEIHRRKVEEN